MKVYYEQIEAAKQGISTAKDGVIFFAVSIWSIYIRYLYVLNCFL